MSETELTFEQAYNRLDELIERLERGGMSLDDAVECYEEASMLVMRCKKVLDSAELKVTEIERAASASGIVEESIEVGEMDFEADDGETLRQQFFGVSRRQDSPDA